MMLGHEEATDLHIGGNCLRNIWSETVGRNLCQHSAKYTEIPVSKPTSELWEVPLVDQIATTSA